ncbi:DUF445 family protein [Cohnella caldifontis]|uniref:DUF445 family protein n=1 Tax=Cohnella caldifontis TaxID=3027471 RepID=UPI0023EE12E2|nr:DUF445 family protein [Cohnella sp. YIM B05605]
MNGWIFVLTNVAVAGLVGGVTNHLAIKMLFHPRKPLVWLGWRVPFTPGLIPKRKQQIAVSLGEVVSEYLVTSEGVRELLEKEEFRRAARERAAEWLARELGDGIAAGDLARKWLGEERMSGWLAELPRLAGERAGAAAAEIWRSGNWGGRRIRDAVPGWNEAAVEGWAAAAAAWGLEAVKEHLVSAEGQALLRRLAVGLMDRTGGFIGMLAGIFVDEDKLVARLTPFLAAQLDSEQVRAQVTAILAKRLGEWGDRTLEEVLAVFAKDEPAEAFLERRVRDSLPWEKWIGRLERYPIGERFMERREEWERRLSWVVDRAMDVVSRQAHSLVAAFRLPEMVRTQVERFPIERLEQVILSVSGKEFKAITWLGVILGGVIGLLQSIILLVWK